MTRAIIDALLIVAVLAAWLGCAGFLRLRTPLDRLHCVTFANWTTVVAIAAASLVADGASNRAFKLLLVALAAVLAGTALSHATGRALDTRETEP